MLIIEVIPSLEQVDTDTGAVYITTDVSITQWTDSNQKHTETLKTNKNVQTGAVFYWSKHNSIVGDSKSSYVYVYCPPVCPWV